jgi:mannosyl-3-phosphoglycerate phosphatase
VRLTSPAAPSLVLVTDLDGCLLDEETYSHDEAGPALDALRESGALLVLCSSKTRAEMEPLARELASSSPLTLIVENGGAVVVPEALLAPRGVPGGRRDRDGWVLELGTARRVLVLALAEIARETGASIRGFSSLSHDEVQSLTGLSPGAARFAAERAYDEPFLPRTPADAALVEAAAQRRGLRVTRGGRFHHLTGPTDKGRALLALLGLLAADGRVFATVGLGDSPNDLSMLAAVDRPILVPRPGGTVDATLAAALPQAARAPAPGPAGWNAAVLQLLGEGVR